MYQWRSVIGTWQLKEPNLALQHQVFFPKSVMYVKQKKNEAVLYNQKKDFNLKDDL